MNPHIVAQQLLAAGLPVLKVVPSEDPQLEDHEVKLTATISVQVPSDRSSEFCLTRETGEGDDWGVIHYRSTTSIAEVAEDFRKAVEQEQAEVYWAVVSEQDLEADGRYQSARVATEREAEELIACLSIIDPEGVHAGLYGIDGPCTSANLVHNGEA